MEHDYKPTTHGRALLAACMDLEKPLKLTRVAVGSGKVAEGTNLADMHELIHYVADGAIADRRHEDNRLCLTVRYANGDHPDVKTFYLAEFMIYAEDPETGEETDLIYATLGDYTQPVPAYNPSYPTCVFNFPLVLIVSDELDVSISAPAGLVTYDELVQLLDSGAAGAKQVNITIPTTGWAADTETGGRYALRCDVPAEDVTGSMLPSLTILPAGEDAAAECGLAPFAQTVAGALRVYARAAPTAAIPASLALYGTSPYIKYIDGQGGRVPIATESAVGAIKASDTIRVDADGTAHAVLGDGAFATDEEVHRALDGIFGNEP